MLRLQQQPEIQKFNDQKPLKRGRLSARSFAAKGSTCDSWEQEGRGTDASRDTTRMMQ